MSESIPWEELKTLGLKYNLSHLILLAYNPATNTEYVSTWGNSIDDCSQAADFGNELKDKLGWPEHLHEYPDRVKKLQDQVKLYETYLRDLYNINIFPEEDQQRIKDEIDVLLSGWC